MSLLNERKKPEPKPAGDGLVEINRRVLQVIKSKKEMAIWKQDLKRETNLSLDMINKSIKNLLGSSLIKKVVNVHMKGKGNEHYIAAEFEPSKEITGGSWYVNGDLDQVSINQLKDDCLKKIQKLKVATAELVYESLNKDCTSQQISEILRSMVLDNMIIEVKSTGLGEYHSIEVGKVCYRPGNLKHGAINGAMVSSPCGICPRIRECTPDGLINPITCVYYTKWLDF